MSRRSWAVVTALGLALVIVALIALAAVRSGSDAGAAAPASPPTATVERRSLTAAEVRDGEVGYTEATTLRTLRRGTLTDLSRTGRIIRRGEVLFRVDQAPTVLMIGDVPAYRTLSDGVAGVDVKQLESTLRALGYRDFTVDRSFTSSTAGAVREWQDDLSRPQTGIVALGDVSFQPAPVRMGAAAADVGALLQPGSPVAEISGADRAVTVTLDESDRDLASTGDPVSVDLGDGDEARGRVEAVETVSTQTQNGSTVSYEVTIELADQGRLRTVPEGAPVDVAFGVETARDVLAVPVKALLALSEGGHGVEVVGESTNTIVAVETGMFADGWVEVESDQLVEGHQVVVAP